MAQKWLKHVKNPCLRGPIQCDYPIYNRVIHVVINQLVRGLISKSGFLFFSDILTATGRVCSVSTLPGTLFCRNLGSM